MDDDVYLTVDQLARHWQVPKSWIYARTAPGSPDPIPCIRVGKYVRFDRGEIGRWLRRKSASTREVE